MAKRDDVFPSKYLKASDLGGKPITVTIESAPLETLKNPEGKEQVKTVLCFKKTKKTLPLNMTNWDSVAEVTGSGDTDEWPGHRIELYPDKTQMGGKTVDCIRIRAPEQQELPTKKPAAKKQPALAAATADDMDDEIPF